MQKLIPGQLYSYITSDVEFKITILPIMKYDESGWTIDRTEACTVGKALPVLYIGRKHPDLEYNHIFLYGERFISLYIKNIHADGKTLT